MLVFTMALQLKSILFLKMNPAYTCIFPLTGTVAAFGVESAALQCPAVRITICLLRLTPQIDTFYSSTLQLLHFKYCTQPNWPQNLSNKEVTFSEVMPIRDFSKVH